MPSLLVKRYLMIDQDKIKIDSDLTIETEEIPARPRKKRKHQNRIVSVTLKDISQHTGEDLNSLLNSANQHRTLYQKFKELRMEGMIKWRHHDLNSDVCMMTDYNSINGNIIPSSYVHVKIALCGLRWFKLNVSKCQKDVKLSKKCQVVKKMSNVKNSNT